MPRSLQDEPMVQQFRDRESQSVVGRGGDGIRPVEPDPVGHGREVLYSGGHWWARCGCGWLSGGVVSEEAAWLVPCEVETLLAESAIRYRRLHGA